MSLLQRLWKTTKVLRPGQISPKPSTLQSARSVSDDGHYPEFCALASRDARTFDRFRSNPDYQEILEHVSPELAQLLVEEMVSDGSPYLAAPHLQTASQNDLVGGPPVFVSVRGVEMSPTTVRYLKVATDIAEHFDLAAIETIAEIGVGYAGQVRLLDGLGIGRRYELFDLAPVLSLAARYLDCYVLNGSVTTHTLNQVTKMPSDLVISMYALSELPRTLQMSYYVKVLKGAKAGLLVMNDCWDFDRLSRDEWSNLLGAKILAEKPLTAPDNYVLIWGDRTG